jgi:hypothetical protein
LSSVLATVGTCRVFVQPKRRDDGRVATRAVLSLRSRAIV